MTRDKFVQRYLSPDNTSKVATRKATPEDIRRATGADAIDGHADRKQNRSKP
jgi:hypothetical protein